MNWGWNDLVELEEIVEEAEGDEKRETPIRDCQEKSNLYVEIKFRVKYTNLE